MSKRTFVVVHPDGTWQKRVAVARRNYEWAVVPEIDNGKQADYYEQQKWFDFASDAGSGYVQSLRDKVSAGQRITYGRAEYRSSKSDAHASAGRNAKQPRGVFTTFRVLPVHEVMPGEKVLDVVNRVRAEA